MNNYIHVLILHLDVNSATLPRVGKKEEEAAYRFRIECHYLIFSPIYIRKIKASPTIILTIVYHNNQGVLL